MKNLRDLVNNSEDYSGEPAKAIFNYETKHTCALLYKCMRLNVQADYDCE